MVNPSTGFMYGDPVGGRWSLWGTINGGNTWDSTMLYLPQAGTEAGWNNAMYYDGSSIWFGTNNTKIYRTANLLQWTAQPTTGQVNSYAVWFNGTSGLTGGTALLYTTNSGTNWGAVASALPGTANISGITGIQPNVYWVIRQGTAIYFTSNSGSNWTTPYTATAGNYRHITKTRFIGQDIYAVRSNGGISKAIVLLTNVQNISSEIPDSYKLGQNYPNPFNPSTTINFDIPKSSDVTIKVFDALGKETVLLVNGKYNSGKYSVTWNAENYPSGVYFYEIKSGDFREVKKMMLVK
jgi:hypothetical protein